MTEITTDTVTRRSSRRRKSKLVPRLVAGGAAALLLTAGVLGYRASAEPASARYRTVVAGPATVAQTISLSGTVHHVSQVNVTFPTAGMVQSVSVKAGDPVKAGQALATIDSTPLRNAVLDAEAAWRAAVSKLDLDQTAYDSASTTTTSTSNSGTSTQAATSAARSSGQPTGQASASSSGQPSRQSSAPSSGQPSGQASAPSSGQPSGPASSGGPRPSGSMTPTAVPTATVQDAAAAIAALQTTLSSIDTNYTILVTKCLPAGLPSTWPSDLPSTIPSPMPSVVTVTTTRTVTVTATRTVTVTAAPAPTGSVSASASGSGAASTTPSAPPSTRPASSASTLPAPTLTTLPLLSGAPISPECQAAITALATLPQTLTQQLATVQTTLLGAQANLTAQAAALQVQAAQLKAQGTALQQQAAALQAQAAALQAQAAALQQQAAAAAAQGAAAAARLGAAGAAKVSEATLIQDRANVAATELALQQAKDRLANATVTSPIDGVVAAIPWVAGQATTGTSAATIIGPGAIEITVPVALAQRPQVEAGQAAIVSSVVNQQSLDAKVTRIGLLPVSTSNAAAAAAAAAAGGAAGTSTTSVSYPVVVTVPAGGDTLPEGSRVQVGIVIAKVAAPVAVPASAVTPLGNNTGTVQVFGNGIAEKRTVHTGVVGGGVVQIVSGVTAGEAVVVADMELPLPGMTINTGRPSQQPQGGPFGSQNQGQQPQQGNQGQQQQPGQGQPTR